MENNCDKNDDLEGETPENFQKKAFEKMEELDADDMTLMNINKTKARRDIVQFVQYSKDTTDAEFARNTLKELPGQFEKYMKNMDIKPVEDSDDYDEEEESSTSMLIS